MGDRTIEYDDVFGINIFKREIIKELGEDFWKKLFNNCVLPDIETEAGCGCNNMIEFMDKLDNNVDSQTLRKILARVRHGLNPSQCEWAREKFLKFSDLDAFIAQCIKEGIEEFENLYENNIDFYGQSITIEVLEFIKRNVGMLSCVRNGNELLCTAFPANMNEYLLATDNVMKRYYACHCPFAKESILNKKSVSATLCYCSFGHIKNFWEAVFERELDGRVITSVLNGDLLCTFSIFLPDDIMNVYVK